MAVNGKRCLIHVGNVFHQILDTTTELIGQGVSRGIRNIDDGCTSGDSSLNDFGEELIIGATSIFSIELNIVDVFLSVFHGSSGTLKNLFRRGAKLVVNMAVRNANTSMDTRALALGQSACGGVDVLFNCARKSADNSTISYLGHNLLNRFKVTRGRHRKARFNDINVKAQ